MSDGNGNEAGLPGTVGFIGLGHMGTPMVRRLAAAGVVVRGHDAAPRTEPAGVTLVEKAPQVAEGASVVILMLPDSDAVEAVVRDAGLLDALAPGTVLVDMGSSEPLRTRALAGEVAARGSTLVDAPVSGGVSGATGGTMTIMAGGPDGVVGGLLPLLAVLSATSTPSAHAARTVELWAEASEALGPHADHTEIVRWLERRGGL